VSRTYASVSVGAYAENKLVKDWNRLFRGFSKFGTFGIFTNNSQLRINNLQGNITIFTWEENGQLRSNFEITVISKIYKVAVCINFI
jgi:hypothetical protein